MRNKHILLKMLLPTLALGLFGCSFEGNQYSPDQVIQNALEETNSIGAYYAESEMIIHENGEELEHSIMKEWRAEDGKIKIETETIDGHDKMIAINDGTKLVLYEEDQKSASIIDDPELLNLNTPSQKEQANQLLKMVENTHTISIANEDNKIAGRETYKLLAQADGSNSFIGNVELWIDKENWMVLKTIVNTGDSKSEMVYTKVKLKQEFKDDLFVIDLPKDVEIQNLDDLVETDEVPIEEAAAELGKSFYYFPEKDGIKLTTVEKTELTGELERTELNLEYTKDGLPFLSLGVFEATEEIDQENLSLPGETAIEIRGNEGKKMESGDFRFLSWQENGVSYSIILYDLELTFDELLAMTDEMELIE